MFGKQASIPKRRVAARVMTRGGESFVAEFHLRSEQRVSDALNDSRAFLPLAADAGDVILNKAVVAFVGPFAKASTAESGKAIPKAGAMLRIRMLDGSEAEGEVMLNQGERPADLLNDASRPFLPLRTEDGWLLVAKAWIASAVPLAEPSQRAVAPTYIGR